MQGSNAKHARPLSFHLAIGAAVMCVVAVVLIVGRAMLATPGGAGANGAEFDGAEVGLLGQEGPARGLHIQMMDRDEPERLAAEFRAERLDPTQPQRYDVTEPRATFYLDNGRVVLVRADRGKLTMPDRTRGPETGTLRDGVVVRVFEPLDDAGEVDLDADEPVLTWTGSELTFDTTLGEATTNEPFVMVSPGYEFRARDARVQIDQVRERLRSLIVRQGGEFTAFAVETPEVQRDSDAEPLADAGSGASPRAASDPANPSAAADDLAQNEPVVRLPIESFYQAVMRDGVELTRAGQHIRSDRLDVYARTVDNALPPGAIAPIDIAQAAAEDPAAPAPSPAAEMASRDDGQPNVAASAAAPDSTTGGDASESITVQPETEAPLEPANGATRLRWTGMLDVRALDVEPAELDDNDLVARFTAERSGVVEFGDEASDASGQAAAVEYGFTTRDLLLTGPSMERSVFLASPSIGEATMGRLEVSLATGVGVVPGPFSVVASDGVGRLDCRERTTLRFNSRDGRITGDLREAYFEGSVRAADDASSIEADTLRTFFEPDQSGVSHLRRLIAVRNVRLGDGRGNGGTCDELDVAFAPGGGEPTPTSFDARGNANFRDRTARVEAEHLYATLRRPARELEDDGPAPGEEPRATTGGLEVAKAWASGSVLFERFTDRIEIRSETLFADLDAELLEVGDDEGLASVRRDRTSIEGESVRLSGIERTVMVEGRGAFEHEAGRGETASHVHAEWTMGMAFDDVAGLLEAAGGVRAVSHPDVRTRERIEAEMLRVELEPMSESAVALASAQEDDGAAQFGGENREVLRVYAAGTLESGSIEAAGEGDGLDRDEGPPMALLESARFVGPLPAWREAESIEASDEPSDLAQSEAPAVPALERAFRLSGVEILSDNIAGTLSVPSAGRLFVADQRTRDESTDGGSDDERGAALFDWTGSLSADREAGVAEMLGDVEMSHIRASDGSRAILESQRLTIRFAPEEGSDPDDLFGGLRSAVAQDRVYLRSDTRELTADVVEYDPDAGIARALAEGFTVENAFGEVRVLDRGAAAPLFARAVIWDLTTDRVDVVDPSTIVIPR